jgi:WD40 repeat protein/serine/threonine protein kinase
MWSRTKDSGETPTLKRLNDNQEAKRPSHPPPAIPGYDIIGELGQGGMGVIFHALHLSLNRPVALKMLRFTHLTAGDQARFRGEAEALARLQHPNIIQVFEVGEHAGQPYCALEFATGGSLAQLLKTSTLAPRHAAMLVEQLAGAVQAAHDAGIVHRDLKPANVLLQHSPSGSGSTDDRIVPRPPVQSESTARGVSSSSGSTDSLAFIPKISDFGLAKFLDRVSSEVTHTGQILGTPCYMAPEQAQGQVHLLGPLVDVYALGAILYETLTGRPPFKGVNANDTLLLVVHNEPVPPSRLQPGLSVDLETICLKCLHKDPRRRYGSARELAEDLRRFLDHKPIRARPISMTERVVKWVRRNPAIAALSLLCTLLAVAGVILVLWQWGDAIAQRDLARSETIARETALTQAEKARADADAARLEASRDRDRARLALWQERTLRHASRLQDAQRLGRDNRWGPALESLDGCAEEQRGWEWAWLRGEATPFLPRLLHGVNRDEQTLSLTPDSRFVCTLGPTGATVRVWDIETGQARFTLAGPSIGTHAPVFSSDGKQLAAPAIVHAAGQRQEQIRVWDATTGESLFTFEKPGEFHAISAFGGQAQPIVRTPEGAWLGLSTDDWKLQVWDLREGKPLPGFPADRKIFKAGFSRDGRTLALIPMKTTALFPETSIELRNPINGELRRTLGPHTASVYQTIFSPNGGRLAGLTHARQQPGRVAELKVWDCSTGSLVRTLTEPPNSEFAEVIFSDDGTHLGVIVVGPGPKHEERPVEVRVYNLTGGQTYNILQTNPRNSPQIALAPDGKRLALAMNESGQDGATYTLRVIDLAAGREVFFPQAPRGVLRSLRFTPDGKRLLCNRFASTPGSVLAGDVLVWDLDKTADSNRALSGHSRPVQAVALSRDEETIASAGQDGTVRIWSAATGKLLRTLEGHAGPVHAVSLHPDGERVASGGEDATLRVRNRRTGETILNLAPFNHRVLGLAHHPDGKELASAGKDGTVRLWELPTGTPRRQFDLPGDLPRDGAFSCVAYNSDGTLLCAGVSLGQNAPQLAPILIWDRDSGERKLRLPAHQGATLAVAFSPDGTLLATAGADRLVKVWDVKRGELVVICPGHRAAVQGVAFSPDGARLFSAGADHTVHIWDSASGQKLLSLDAGASLSSLACGPLGQRIIAGGADSAVHLWQASPSRDRFTFQGHSTGVIALALDRKGHALATLGAARLDPVTHRIVEPSSLKLWDANTGRERLSLPASVIDDSPNLVFLPDGDHLAGVTWDAERKATRLQLWDAVTSETKLNIPAVRSAFRQVAVDPAGKILAVTREPDAQGKPALVELYSIEGGKLLRKLEGARAALSGVCFSPDGTRIAAGGADFVVYVWESASGKLVQSLTGHRSGVLCVAFSPDGQRLVSGTSDRGQTTGEVRPAEVKVWNLAQGQATLTLTGHQAQVSAVSFSPDGTRVVSGSWDRTVKVWDAKTGRCLETLDGHTDRVSGLAFHPDGRLFTASFDHVVKVWQLTASAKP